MTKPPTYDDLKARNEMLHRELTALQDARTEDEALVKNTVIIRAKVYALLMLHDKHPWASQKVYEAGMELIKAVRKET